MPNNYLEWSSEDLIKEIKQLKKRKKFGLVWEEKPEDVVLLCQTKLPVLVESADRSIQKSNELQNNIIIEGDNYHALSVLNYTHANKIDVIYIDPPYNTGSKDFIYNDRYVDKEDGYRHSKWLSFMSTRLRLAKHLLAKEGIIFISIDDNEFAQLRLLCNEIFGEHNFIGTVTWEKRTKAQNTETAREMFQAKTEYVLVYKKGSDKIKFNLEVTGEKTYDHQDGKGIYRLKRVEEMSLKGMRGRQSMVFAIKGVVPRDGYQWKIGKDQIQIYSDRDDIEILEKRVYLKIRPHEEDSRKFLPFWSHFLDKNVYGTAETGKAELTEILGSDDHGFETVKPLNLIKKLLFHINKGKNEIVLDFFAGSGTTAQAVLQLNKEDGGNRRFILCTNNENGIAENITLPRVRNVINGYSYKGKSIQGIPSNVKYYKTAFVDQVVTDADKRNFVNHATEMLCLAEGTFEEVALHKNHYSIFTNEQHTTCIIYDEDYLDESKEALNKIEKRLPTVIYVFSYDNTYDSDDFEGISRVIKVKPIPSDILNVYNRIKRENSRKMNQ